MKKIALCAFMYALQVFSMEHDFKTMIKLKVDTIKDIATWQSVVKSIKSDDQFVILGLLFEHKNYYLNIISVCNEQSEEQFLSKFRELRNSEPTFSKLFKEANLNDEREIQFLKENKSVETWIAIEAYMTLTNGTIDKALISPVQEIISKKRNDLLKEKNMSNEYFINMTEENIATITNQAIIAAKNDIITQCMSSYKTTDEFFINAWAVCSHESTKDGLGPLIAPKLTTNEDCVIL